MTTISIKIMRKRTQRTTLYLHAPDERPLPKGNHMSVVASNEGGKSCNSGNAALIPWERETINLQFGCNRAKERVQQVEREPVCFLGVLMPKART